MSIREAIFGREDEDDVEEDGITDDLNTSDDSMNIFMKFFGTMIVGLFVTLLIGKTFNISGITAFNSILKVSLIVFVVGVVVTLALLIFIYNMFAVIMKAIFDITVPKFELVETTTLIVDLLLDFMTTV